MSSKTGIAIALVIIALAVAYIIVQGGREATGGTPHQEYQIN